jgi:hypothetical protein
MDRGGYDTFEILREELDTRLRDLLQANNSIISSFYCLIYARFRDNLLYTVER